MSFLPLIPCVSISVGEAARTLAAILYVLPPGKNKLYVSVSKIAAVAGLDSKTIRRHLAILVAKGFLSKIGRQHRRTNTYVLRFRKDELLKLNYFPLPLDRASQLREWSHALLYSLIVWRIGKRENGFLCDATSGRGRTYISAKTGLTPEQARKALKALAGKGLISYSAATHEVRLEGVAAVSNISDQASGGGRCVQGGWPPCPPSPPKGGRHVHCKETSIKKQENEPSEVGSVFHSRGGGSIHETIKRVASCKEAMRLPRMFDSESVRDDVFTLILAAAHAACTNPSHPMTPRLIPNGQESVHFLELINIAANSAQGHSPGAFLTGRLKTLNWFDEVKRHLYVAKQHVSDFAVALNDAFRERGYGACTWCNLLLPDGWRSRSDLKDVFGRPVCGRCAPCNDRALQNKVYFQACRAASRKVLNALAQTDEDVEIDKRLASGEWSINPTLLANAMAAKNETSARAPA